MNKTPNNQSANTNITIGKPIELVVLACKSSAVRCRVPGTARELTLRTAVRDEVPGDIVTVTPTREWTHRQHTYLAGAVTSIRQDVTTLGLTPFALRDMGEWDPAQEYWGEEDAPLDEWAQAIIAHGKRRSFEMEQVIPGADPEDFDSDAIVEAAEGLCLWRLNRVQEATAVMNKLLWLNPSDNQGARFNLAAVEAGKAWEA